MEKGKIKGAETVKGGESHKKTLTSAGVPKSIQKKLKKLLTLKKGKKNKQNLIKNVKKQVNFLGQI